MGKVVALHVRVCAGVQKRSVVLVRSHACSLVFDVVVAQVQGCLGRRGRRGRQKDKLESM